MAKRMDMPRRLACAIGLAGTFWFPSALAQSPAATAPQPPPYVYVARAHIVEVKRAFVGAATADIPGAGVRAFQPPGSDLAGSERFEIRWYANPPGIPPGAVVLFEYLQDRQGRVRNQALRLAQKSEGHVRSVVEIPAEDVRRAGRVREWRVSIVWRDRALATQSSDPWTG